MTNMGGSLLGAYSSAHGSRWMHFPWNTGAFAELMPAINVEHVSSHGYGNCSGQRT